MCWAVGQRAAILTLNVRLNRLYSAGLLAGWITTFRHYGMDATQRCVALQFSGPGLRFHQNLFRPVGVRTAGPFSRVVRPDIYRQLVPRPASVAYGQKKCSRTTWAMSICPMTRNAGI